MGLSDLTVTTVIKAIEEFDRLHREPFLKKYGFRKSRSYVIQRNGRVYDSKAIAGAAHGYLPGHRAMRFDEFSGGEVTVAKILGALGFTVVRGGSPSLPSIGDVLTNNEIGGNFFVGNMGGMRRSKKLNLLVLISDPFKGLYQDRWEGRVLHYTGMGPTGPQSLTYAQNRTLAESVNTKIPVHLLEALDSQKYTYVGEVDLVGSPYQEDQLDTEGKSRKVWMFPLKVKNETQIPTLTEQQARAIEESHSRIARRLSTAELKKRAALAKKQPSKRTAQTTTYVRDAAIAELSKRLANGMCDLCEKQAPFKNKKNESYLECHHIVWLAQGGDDTIENTVALCPNCHRKMHVLNQKVDKDRLKKRAAIRATK